MLVSELIEQLYAMQEIHGDIHVLQAVDAGIAPVGDVEYVDDSQYPHDVDQYVLISEEC